MSSTHPTYYESSTMSWMNNSYEMRERIGNEMKAQMLNNADHETRLQYNEKQAQLRRAELEELALQYNLTLSFPAPSAAAPAPTYWPQPSTFPATAIQIASPLPPLLDEQHMHSAQLQACPASISAMNNNHALLQPALPMYPLANAGCLVYEQNHANGYIMQTQTQPQPLQQHVLYVNNHNNTNHAVATTQPSVPAANVHYVDYNAMHSKVAMTNPANSKSMASVQSVAGKYHQDGNNANNTKGRVAWTELEATAAMASVGTLMAAPAASTSTLGTFVRSNESVQNMDSAVNPAVNCVNYAVADHELEHELEDCLNFYCGGEEEETEILYLD